MAQRIGAERAPMLLWTNRAVALNCQAKHTLLCTKADNRGVSVALSIWAFRLILHNNGWRVKLARKGSELGTKGQHIYKGWRSVLYTAIPLLPLSLATLELWL